MKEQLVAQIYDIGVIGGIILVTIITAYLFRRFFGRLIKKSTAHMNNDPTNYVFLKHVITALIYIVGFSWAFYRIEPLRAIASSLLAGAGILAVVVGFASQHALSNVISGLFIVMFKPFRVNDIVTLISNNQTGVIEEITLRHVVIRDFQNRRVVIPNSIMSDEIILNANMTDDRINRWIEVGISYDSNIDLARSILREEIKKHPLYIDGRTPEQIDEGVQEVPVRLTSLGDFSVNLRANAWTEDPVHSFQLACDVLESTKKRYDEEGVEIPFPYRTIVYKSDLDKNP
ncbi:MAG: mechanosensitive ion channel family protein [Saprospiraceae bacterium]|nr:mechanosensitive ion channel family protein [Saprospiraceae bacterium]